MSDVDKVTEAVNNIAQAFSDLHGGAELREEIARLKAINAKLGGEVAKKTAEISRVRESQAQAQGWQEIELRRRHEEIRGLREDLHFKDAEIKELKASLERKDKAAIQISKNNASLREQLEYQTKASRRHQSIADELAGVVNEVRRALDDYDDEED